MLECGKCKSRRTDGLVCCEGTGKTWFYSTYVGFSEAEFRLFEKTKTCYSFVVFMTFTDIVNIFLAEIINKTNAK